MKLSEKLNELISDAARAEAQRSGLTPYLGVLVDEAQQLEQRLEDAERKLAALAGAQNDGDRSGHDV